MSELFPFLFVIALVLGVITVLGHGIWVVLAKLFGAGGERPRVPSPPRNPPSACCRVCGNMVYGDRARCRRCGALVLRAASSAGAQAQANETVERQAAIRQIDRLWRTGQIDGPLHERLVRLLHAPPVETAPQLQRQPSPATAEQSPHKTPAIAPAIGGQHIPQVTDNRQPPQSASPIVLAQAVEPDSLPLLAAEVIAERPRAANPPNAESPASQPLGAMLQAFLESRNIRWGELASGMLIVGSAVGLVISLRETLRNAIPYFPALIFMLATAAIYGAGIYTLRRWRLRSTSRGLLTIVLLLVPLNFLSAVLLSKDRTMADPLYWIATVTGIVCFGLIALSACRELVPWSGRWLAAGIIGSSAAMLIIDRTTTIKDPSAMLLLALAILPVLAFMLGTARTLIVGVRSKSISPRRAGQFYLVAGVAAFSMATALSLLVWRGESLRATLALLTPALSLSAAVVLAIGLLIHLKTAVAGWRTSGTAVAIAAATAMAGIVGLAWPRPDLLIAVALLDFVLLSLLARASRFHGLHTVAVVCLAVASLLAVHRPNLATGLWEPAVWQSLMEVWLSGNGALSLTFFAAAAAGVALALTHRQYVREAWAYFGGARIVAVAGFAGAVYSGFWTGTDNQVATYVLAMDALGAIAAAFFLCRQDVTLAASGSVLLAVVHAMLYHPEGVKLLDAIQPAWQHRWAAVLLTHATIVVVLAAAAAIAGVRRLQERAGERAKSFVAPLATTAAATSAVAVALTALVAESRFALHAGYLLWVAAAWLVVSLVLRRREILAATQVVATLGICYLNTAYCQRQPWWTGQWLAARHVELQLIVLSLWAAGCHAVRQVARMQPSIAGLAKARGFTVERILIYALMIVMFSLAVIGCWTGVAVQLGHEDTLPTGADWQALYSISHGWGGWLVWATVALSAAVVTQQSRRSGNYLYWPPFSTAVPLMIACRWESQQAVASALAWSLGLYFIAGTLIAAARGPLKAQLVKLSSQRGAPKPGSTSMGLSIGYAMLGFRAAVPVLLLVGAATVAAGQGRLLSPATSSLFDQLGPAATWCIPLLLIGTGLAIAAARERISLLALAACAVVMAAVPLATIIPTWLSGKWLDLTALAVILQRTTMVAGTLAIMWLWALRRWGSSSEISAAKHDGVHSFIDLKSDPLTAQLGLVGVLATLLAAWPAFVIFQFPGTLPAVVSTLGQWQSYVGLALSVAAFVLEGGRVRGIAANALSQSRTTAVAVAALVIPLVAASMSSHNTSSNWLSFHVLSGGWMVTALLATAASVWTESKSVSTLAAARISALFAAPALAFAIRGTQIDPLSPWWSTGLAAATALIAGIHAVRTRREALAYLAVMLSMGTLLLYKVDIATKWSGQELVNWTEQTISLVAILATGWLLTTLGNLKSAAETIVNRAHGIPFSRAALVGGLIATAAVVVLGSLAAQAGIAWRSVPLVKVSDLWGWGTVVCLGLLIVAALWSADSQLAPIGGYVLGLVTLGMGLDAAQLPYSHWALGVVTGTAAWIALTGILWNLRTSWIAIGKQLQIRQPEETVLSVWRWLPTISVLLTAAVVLAAGWAGLFGHLQMTRTMAGAAVALAAGGLAMFGQGHLRRRMPRLALLVAGIAAVYLGWSMVPHNPDATFSLRMSIRTLVALGAMTAVYGIGLVKLLDNAAGGAGDWFAATRQAAAALGVASLSSLIVVLALEAVHFQPDGRVVALVDVAQVAIVLVGLSGALLSLALQKGADPLGLTEKGRMLYVYGAQLVLALLFAHIYLTMPQLFQGILRPYWPLIVMGVSYAGVIFGLLARRAGLRVLAEPLERTGGFLPLLPALGFWFFATDIKVSYSTVMAAVGVGYVMLSTTERRLIYRVAAAIAGNVALWALMHERGIAPWNYPSFWAIPPALSLLAAAQLNRHRLSSEQLTAVRYFSITVIYLSSTGQVWLALGESLWPPMLLALLSVAGILSGMALRVRAFLYQGMSFLALAVLSMIWHASRSIGHVWPWWAFGVVLGLSILALFGLFEKNRPEVLLRVQRMRQWER